MIEYSVYDSDGRVIQSGTAQDETHVRQVFPRARIEFGIIRPVERMITTDSYAVKRRRAYPTIGEQMDAIWKGGDAAREMLEKIMAVKAKYPKDAA